MTTFFVIGHGPFRKFADLMGLKASEGLPEVTREELTRFRNELADRLASETADHHVKVLRMVFRDAKRGCLIVDDPTEFVGVVKEKWGINRRPSLRTNSIRISFSRKSPSRRRGGWTAAVLRGFGVGG